MKSKSTPNWLYLLFAANGVFMLMTLANYPGRGYIYLIFSVLLNALLFFGLRRGSLFFDTFLGVFFWIGFWLKFSVRTVFAEGRFRETVGYFDYSADAYDRALLVTSCGIAGLLIARLIRERFLFESLVPIKIVSLDGVRAVYDQHRNVAWFGFCILVLGVTLTNADLGIYQRGSVPRTVLPYGLGGVYTWLLLFGASSISAMLLHFELQLRARMPFFLILLMLMETFLSNVSMLSRGMILNAGALLLGVYISGRAYGVMWRFRVVVMTLAALLVLFATSIFVVGQMRSGFADDKPAADVSLQTFQLGKEKSGEDQSSLALARGIVRNPLLDWTVLLMDRWVGMEGAMAVSSYPNLGWDLWREVWEEKYSDRGTSLYDRKISKSRYLDQDLSNLHFVSVPGVLAFFFYPGSYGFLFLAMLALGILGAVIEAMVYRWGGGNLILCSLMSLVVTSRYVHFGYVPGQTYLLSGALVLNVALIYLLGRVLAYGNRVGEQVSRSERTKDEIEP